MSEHATTEDDVRQVVLMPHLRVWFDRQRSWHRDRVRVHGETRWVADGTPAEVTIYLEAAAGGRGRELQRGDAQILGGRLVGPDSARGFEHRLEWRLGETELGAGGLVARVLVPAYALSAASQTLPLDLQPFTISG